MAERARWALRHYDGAVFPSWPDSEQLAVGLVLRDHQRLDELAGGQHAALDRLCDLLGLREHDELRAWITRVRVLCVDGPDADDDVPAAQLPTGAATELARHVKAALLHLHRAEALAEDHGIDPLAARHADPAGALLREVGEHASRLDDWAINTAVTSGAPRRGQPGHPYASVDRWCHTPGGVLPHHPAPEETA